VWVGTSVGLVRLTAEGLVRVPVGNSAPDSAPDVYALAERGDEVVWAAAGSSLYSVPAAGAAELALDASGAGVGVIKAIRRSYDADTLWLLGDAGAALVTAASPSSVVATSPLVAQDVLPTAAGAYFATADGVVAVSQAGRVFLPSVKQVGGAPARAMSREVGASPFWVGARGALAQAEGLWSTFEVEGHPCINDLIIEGDVWWIATPEGLYTVDVAGAVTLAQAGSFYALAAAEGGGVWAADASGAYIARLGQPTVSHPLPLGLNAQAVKAVELIDGELWLGGVSSLARARVDGQALGPWEVSVSGTEPYLPQGEVRAFGRAGIYVWIAVYGDHVTGQGGLARFQLNTRVFNSAVYTFQNGAIPSNLITSLYTSDSLVAVGTEGGGRVFNPNAIVESSNLYLNAGIPPAAGTNAIASLLYSDSALYALLEPSLPAQRYGSLLQVSRAPQGLPLLPGSERLYPSAELDMLTLSGEQLARARLRLQGRGPYVTLTTCGLDGAQGGVSLLPTASSVTQRVPEERLRQPSDSYALTPSLGAHLSWVQSFATGAPEAPSYALQVTDLAPLPPVNAGLADPRPPRAIDGVTRKLLSCRRYLPTSDAVVGRLVCLLEGNYLTTNVGGVWSVEENPLFDGQPLEVRSFVVDPDQPTAIRWYATSGGLMQMRATTLTSYTQASTMGGLKSDDTTAVLISSAARRVYVGLSSGLVSKNLDAAPSLPPADAWAEVSALRGVRVNDLALHAASGDVWAATSAGLARVSGLDVTRYGTSQGLPSSDVRRVRVTPAGRVYALHASGLSVYADGAWRHYGPRAGVPADATDLELGADGDVWVASPLGAARVQVP